MRACVALWFLLAGGDLGLVHGCPMHDGMHAASASSHRAAGHAGMGEHHHQSSQHPASHACTCVGACSAPAAVAAVSGTPVVLAAIALHAAPAPLGDAGVTLAGPAPHELPFANGPPVVRTA